jgi:hypothetical protein
MRCKHCKICLVCEHGNGPSLEYHYVVGQRRDNVGKRYDNIGHKNELLCCDCMQLEVEDPRECRRYGYDSDENSENAGYSNDEDADSDEDSVGCGRVHCGKSNYTCPCQPWYNSPKINRQSFFKDTDSDSDEYYDEDCDSIS